MNKLVKTTLSLPTKSKEAPKEFKIWKYGNNLNDYGDAIFNENSAKHLMDEQAKRGNLYSIDWNHMSLSDVALPESTGAAGWHKLEVRKDAAGKPELWAVEVEWTETAKKGLEADVPQWRYFSPAFFVDGETKEIISYTNTALCINPATHNNTMLASRKTNSLLRKTTMDEMQMKLQALKDLLALVGAEGVADDTKAALQPAIDKLVLELGGKEKVDEMMKAEQVNAEAAKIVEAKKGEDVKVETKEAVETSKKEDKGMELALQVAELTAKLAKQDVEKLVKANVGTKIPEALEAWALDQDMNTITKYLAKAPLINTAKTQVTTTAAVKGDVKTISTVSPEVAYIKKSFGLSAEPVTASIISKEPVNGSKNLFSINTVTPKEYKAFKNSQKK